jgi:RNA polymerase sigma-32 factor
MVAEYRRTGDARIERALVETNLRLVAKLASQLDRTHGRCWDDLLQEGCLGLLQGIRRFDPTRGTRLATYASFWIRAFIVKYAMDNVRLVRVVRTRAARVAFFRGSIGSQEVSLDAPTEPDRGPLGDLVADPALPADRRLETAELACKARRSAAKLERRLIGRDLVILRERVLSADPTPLRALAERVALSRERVRQVEGRLRAAIRHDLEAPSMAAA